MYRNLITLALALACACANDPKLADRQAAFKATREKTGARSLAEPVAARPDPNRPFLDYFASRPDDIRIAATGGDFAIGMTKEDVRQTMAWRRARTIPGVLCQLGARVERGRSLELWLLCPNEGCGDCPGPRFTFENGELVALQAGAVDPRRP